MNEQISENLGVDLMHTFCLLCLPFKLYDSTLLSLTLKVIIRGHDESAGSKDRGNYVELLSLIAESNTDLHY